MIYYSGGRVCAVDIWWSALLLVLQGEISATIRHSQPQQLLTAHNPVELHSTGVLKDVRTSIILVMHCVNQCRTVPSLKPQICTGHNSQRLYQWCDAG